MTSATTYKPKLVTTPVFEWNFRATERVRINQGGTSSGKTYALLQVLMVMLLEKKRIATVVGQDIPNLKKGALRDFEERLLPTSKWFASQVKAHNKTDRQFILKNGSIIEFSSFSDAQDAKNGKRDLLFVNEANGISYAIYQQLAMRTNEVIFIDYNPTNTFWVHEHLMGEPDTVVFYSNFTHNPFADPNIVQFVRRYKDTDLESWRVYGLGKTGNIKGLVFRHVKWVDSFPENARKQCYGLDFGYTNDPTALVRIGEVHGEIYGEELIYKLGMTNQDIADEI